MPKKLSAAKLSLRDELLEEVSHKEDTSMLRHKEDTVMLSHKEDTAMLSDSLFVGNINDLSKKNVIKNNKAKLESKPLKVVDEETKKQMLLTQDKEIVREEKKMNIFPSENQFTRSDIFAPFDGRFQPANKDALETAVDLWFSDNVEAVARYGDIKYWDTSYVEDMSRLFKRREDFNEMLYWNTSKVKDMSEMFYDAKNFNQDITQDTVTIKQASHVIIPEKLDLNGDRVRDSKRIEIEYFLSAEQGDGDSDKKETIFGDIKNIRVSIKNSADGLYYPVENSSWTTLDSVSLNFSDILEQTLPLLTGVLPESLTELARQNGFLNVELLLQQLKVILDIQEDAELNNEYRSVIVSYPDASGSIVNDLGVVLQPNLLTGLKTLSKNILGSVITTLEQQRAVVNAARVDAGQTELSLLEYIVTLYPDFVLPDGVTLEKEIYEAVIDNLDVEVLYGQITPLDSIFTINNLEIISSNDILPVGSEDTYTVWDTSDVTDMSYMFKNAEKFDQEIRSFMRNDVTLTDMFSGATAFLEKYGISATPQPEFYTPLNDDTLKPAIADYFDADKKAELLSKHGKLKYWNTVGVTDMSNLFREKSDFNEEIDGWNVTNVTNFEKMFSGCSSFNKPINKWTLKDDDDAPLNMRFMFDGAENLDVEIRGWKVNAGSDLEGIIEGATKLQARHGITVLTHDFFIYDKSDLQAAVDLYCSLLDDGLDISAFNAIYGPIEKLYTNTVTDMSSLFYNKTNFNADISAWDVSQVTTMAGMFAGAVAFNQDIGQWNVSKVTDMSGMFFVAAAFNQDIGQWDVSNVEFMDNMFVVARAFNQPIGGWNVSKVTDMGSMFVNAVAFNQPIGGWNVSEVQYMNSMFRGAVAFNQPIGGWNVSKVKQMSSMFENARSFNQPIGGWNVSKVMLMNSMFENARSFNQDIGQWDVSEVARMDSMFYGAAAFNRDINTKEVPVLKEDGTVDTNEDGTVKTRTAWDVKKVQNMSDMFYKATSFNGDISKWNVSEVKNMKFMFYGNISFNQDISKWTTDNLEEMQYMFAFANEFNQDISTKEVPVLNEDGTVDTTYTAWDLSKVKDLKGAFYNRRMTDLGNDVIIDKPMKIDFDISKWNLDSNKIDNPTSQPLTLSQHSFSKTENGVTSYLSLDDYHETTSEYKYGWVVNEIKFGQFNSRAIFNKIDDNYYLVITKFGPRYLYAYGQTNDLGQTVYSYYLTPSRVGLYSNDLNVREEKRNASAILGVSSFDTTKIPNFKLSKNVNKQQLKHPLLEDREDSLKTKAWRYSYTPNPDEGLPQYKYASHKSINKTHMLVINPKQEDMDVVTGFLNDKYTTTLRDSGFIKSEPEQSDLDIPLYTYSDIGDVYNGLENASAEKLTKTVKDVLGSDCVKFTLTREYTEGQPIIDEDGENLGLEYDNVKITQFVGVATEGGVQLKSDFVKMFDYIKNGELKQRVCYQIFATGNPEVETVTKQHVMKPLSDRVNIVSDYAYDNEHYEIAEFNVKRRDDGIPYYVITEPQDVYNEEGEYVETLSVLYREEGLWTLKSETEVNDLSVSQLCSYTSENGISGTLDIMETKEITNDLLPKFVFEDTSISGHLPDEDNYYIVCDPLFAYALSGDSVTKNVPLSRMIGQPETEVLGIHNGIIHPTLRKEFFENDISDKSKLTARLSELTSDRYETNQKYGLIKYWDVSRVTDMSLLFYFNSDFNEDISGWDVSNVTTMREMFYGAAAFNQAIGQWNVSQVTDMKSMFDGAAAFNQDIGQWNVSQVTNMQWMFYEASAFNQDISTKVVNEGLDTQYNAWDISNTVTTDGRGGIYSMFYNAYNFNNGEEAGLSNKPLLWDISGNTSLESLFYNCASFNQNISTKYVTVGEKSYISFDTSKVNNMNFTFVNAYHFNNGDVPGGSSKPLNWNTELVTTVFDMFAIYPPSGEKIPYILPYEVRKTLPLTYEEIEGPEKIYKEGDLEYLTTGAYNQPFNNDTRVEFGEGENKIAYTPFDLSRCETINGMMYFQGFFNQPITLSLGSCTDLAWALANTRSFNNTVKISSTGDDASFIVLLRGASSFNQPLDDINTSKCRTLEAMLMGALEFNQSIDSLDLGNATNLINLLRAAYKFNQPINQHDLPNVTNVYQMLRNATSFNQPINLDTKNVQSFYNMLKGATSFNQPLTLDLRSATNLTGLLDGATSFNQEIVSELVTEEDENGNTVLVSNKMSLTTASDVSKMLKDCTGFNQSLDKFDFTNVRNMTSFLEGATSFNQNIKDINVGNVTDMTAMLKGCTSFNKSLDGIDASSVTKMESLLEGATGFNSSIEKMNTPNVTSMKNMLKGASSFNKPLTKLNLTNVTTLEGFLEDAISYNKRFVFSDTDKLNTANVTSMKNMLKGAKNFNQEVVDLDTNNVTTMISMLEGATSFNKSIVGLPGTSTAEVARLLKGATSYNKSLEGLDTSNFTNVNGLLEGATSFNQPLKLNFPAAMSLKGLLKGATAFNSELSDLDLSKGEKIIGQKVFNDDVNGDGTIDYLSNNINTSRGLFTNLAIGQMDGSVDFNVDEYHHFKPHGTTLYTSDISHIMGSTWSINNPQYDSFITCNIKNMHGSIVDDDTINLQLTTEKNGRGAFGNPWNNNVPNLYNMFLDTAMIHGPFKSNTITFTVKGDKILSDDFIQKANWYNNFITLAVYQRDSNGTYRFGKEIHNVNTSTLKSTYFGTTRTAIIPDDYLDSDSVVVFIVQENDVEFSNSAALFDADDRNITIEVKDIGNLFYAKQTTTTTGLTRYIVNPPSIDNLLEGASSFNQPLQQLDTSSITSMKGLLKDASSFNQELGYLDVSNVTDMSNMFENATAFTGAGERLHADKNIRYWTVKEDCLFTDMFKGATKFQENFFPTAPGYELDENTPLVLFFNQERPCFDASTKILAIKDGKEEYVPISLLKEGDLVQTYKHGPKPIKYIGTTRITLNGPGDDYTLKMYRMKKTDSMTDDLLVTGRHAMLVDDWRNHYCKNRRSEVSAGKIDDKYVLGAAFSNLFTEEKQKKLYSIYHLEIDGENQRYGIYANGVLAESLQKGSIKNLKA